MNPLPPSPLPRLTLSPRKKIIKNFLERISKNVFNGIEILFQRGMSSGRRKEEEEEAQKE